MDMNLQHAFDIFLLVVSFATLVLLTVWGIYFVPEENIMTQSLGMKMFSFIASAGGSHESSVVAEFQKT